MTGLRLQISVDHIHGVDLLDSYGLLLRCSENEGELERDMSCLSRARGARRVELSTGRSMPMKTY